MKLNDESLNWIYQHLNELERTLVALDYSLEHRRTFQESYTYADKKLHDLIFSFLMVAMGESIPRTLWGVADYSVLYGLIDENRDLDGIELSDNE